MQRLIVASTTPPAPAMPRQSKSKPAGLTINPKPDLERPKDGDSPPPKSSPMNLEGIDLSSFGGDIGPDFATLPPLPQSPPLMPPPSPGGHKRDPSKTFLTNFKTRISPEQEQRERGQVRQVKDDNEYRPGSSSMSKIYHLRKDPGSTPELSLLGSAENVDKQSGEVNNAPAPAPATRPPPSSQHSDDTASVKRKEKGFRNPLSRSKSIRRDSNSKSKPNGKQSLDQPPKTAPLQSDWPGSNEIMFKKNKDRRGKSAERAIASESEEHLPRERPQTKDKDKGGFVTSSKSVMSKAVTGGGNLFNRLGKIGRSSSNHEREVPDSEYVFKVINLPLIEQVRITRISKDLGSCKDKTEYWMPSLPWRCIDYLNLNCEAEGLYRVPGSGPQVKYWQRRFDTELDLDLLDEQELYDPNNIGSMFKSWLRDLPTEIFPKAIQLELGEELAKENPEYQRMGQAVPQQLKDALSNLPPFNYYLLFAITCHLSLLLSHQDRNRMDLNNLSICIGPCLDLERWLFNYLVGAWKQCWQGCYTEKEYLQFEKEYEQGLAEQQQQMQPPPTRSGNAQQQSQDRFARPTRLDDRNVHSSSSGRSRSRGGSSHYEDARSARQSPHRGADHAPPAFDVNSQSSTALFSQLGNGTIAGSPGSRRVASPDALQQRPATSGKQSADNGKVGTPTHGRSQSDFQLEVQPSSPIDFPFVTAARGS